MLADVVAWMNRWKLHLESFEDSGNIGFRLYRGGGVPKFGGYHLRDPKKRIIMV